MPPANTSSWTDLVRRLAPASECAGPAGVDALAAAEEALGIPLPGELREVLRECGGIDGEYGEGVVWPAAKIAEENRRLREDEELRELYMAFDALLFFADDGGGDQFAFAVQADGRIHKPDVYRWRHETDAREWYAGGMERYLERRSRNEGDDEAG